MLRALMALLHHLDKPETSLKQLPVSAVHLPVLLSAQLLTACVRRASTQRPASRGTLPPWNQAVFDLPLTRSG